jgi:hypothetical protein
MRLAGDSGGDGLVGEQIGNRGPAGAPVHLRACGCWLFVGGTSVERCGGDATRRGERVRRVVRRQPAEQVGHGTGRRWRPADRSSESAGVRLERGAVLLEPIDDVVAGEHPTGVEAGDDVDHEGIGQILGILEHGAELGTASISRSAATTQAHEHRGCAGPSRARPATASRGPRSSPSMKYSST